MRTHTFFSIITLFGVGCSFSSDTKINSERLEDSFVDDSGSVAEIDTSTEDTGIDENIVHHDCMEERYTPVMVLGWEVCIESSLFIENEAGDAVVVLLTHDLTKIIGMIHPDIVASLQTVRIWVEKNGDWGGAVYHPSASWLMDNNYPVHWAESIQIGNAADYLSWTSIQPAMVLHELSHAWHHQFIGYDNPDILDAYTFAMDSGIYENVPYAGGGNSEAYAKTNALEYFAELTEAWFWENDFYPFTRIELLEFDPLGASVVEDAWSVE